MAQFDPASPVNRLADGFWEAILAESPSTATMYGDERYDDRLEDPSSVGRGRARTVAETTLAAADAIVGEDQGLEDRITLDMVRVICQLQVEQDDQRIDLLRTVDQMGGPQTLLPTLATFQQADTPERLDRFIARLQSYPTFMAAHIELLREGIASGLTAPRIVTERTIAQLERLLQTPAEESVVVTMARVASDADRAHILDVVRDQVMPADQAFLDALRGEYLAASRTDPGLWSAPNGDALYRTQILAQTTLELEPADLHQIGLDQLERIEAERRVIARSQGFADDTIAYRAHLAADPANTPTSSRELLARAREDIDRAMAIAPRYFGTLPRAACEVRAVEEYKERDSPFAYYFAPTTDGKRPGVYYANTYDLASRNYSKLASTTYHEAVPGHHFQIAMEMENERLSTFRRLGARIVAGSYVEGWGLYSERLADEMGLFRNEAERFGMLDAMAWRAGRLVVDTGLHALRWPRQRSIDFLRGAGLSDTDAVIETDRYICWPGQALTYMVGQREIERLRAEIERRDGSAFDLRAFHDAVLGHGSLPLATLARELPTWVATPA
ncbi:MAG: DUF885 domain-containing protein [Candidatus Limnocylindrales bacterium]